MTFPFVSTAFTVPATTLVLAAAGAACWRGGAAAPATPPSRGRGRAALAGGGLPAATPKGRWPRPGADVDLAPEVFLGLHVLGPMAVLALPSAPIFGGVKHFLTAMPFLAVAAGIGLSRPVSIAVAAARTSRALARGPALAAALPVALSAVVVLPAVLETRRSEPDGLSDYNIVAGGFAGGASLGMNRQFWGYSVQPMLPWIAQHRRPRAACTGTTCCTTRSRCTNATASCRTASPTPATASRGIQRSDLAIVIHERHMRLFEGYFWDAYGTAQPALVRAREGVPLVIAYRRPGTPVTPPRSPRHPERRTAEAGPRAGSHPRHRRGPLRPLADVAPASPPGTLRPLPRVPRRLRGAGRGAAAAPLEYNHFVYLADGWLKGRLALEGTRPTRTTGRRSRSSSCATGASCGGSGASPGPPIASIRCAARR